MRFIDRQGREVPNGTKCLIVRNNGDDSSTVYYTSDEDLNALVNDMKSSGIIGPKTTTDYWRSVIIPNTDCAYRVPDGCDIGGCSNGNECTAVVDGDYTYCSCVG